MKGNAQYLDQFLFRGWFIVNHMLSLHSQNHLSILHYFYEMLLFNSNWTVWIWWKKKNMLQTNVCGVEMSARVYVRTIPNRWTHFIRYTRDFYISIFYPQRKTLILLNKLLCSCSIWYWNHIVFRFTHVEPKSNKLYGWQLTLISMHTAIL